MAGKSQPPSRGVRQRAWDAVMGRGECRRRLNRQAAECAKLREIEPPSRRVRQAPWLKCGGNFDRG